MLIYLVDHRSYKRHGIDEPEELPQLNSTIRHWGTDYLVLRTTTGHLTELGTPVVYVYVEEFKHDHDSKPAR